MKKIFISIIVILAIIAFFYPKDEYFSCGGVVCLPEAPSINARGWLEKDTQCLGFKKASSQTYTETNAMGCYGIFFNKSYF